MCNFVDFLIFVFLLVKRQWIQIATFLSTFSGNAWCRGIRVGIIRANNSSCVHTTVSRVGVQGETSDRKTRVLGAGALSTRACVRKNEQNAF